MMQGDQRDACAQLYPLGLRCCGHFDYRRRSERIAGVMMVAEPYHMEAQLFFELHLLENLGIVLRGRTMRLRILIGVIENSEFHQNHPLTSAPHHLNARLPRAPTIRVRIYTLLRPTHIT